MKKVFLTILVSICMLVAAGNASAMPFILDPDAALSTSFGTTGILGSIQFYSQTTSTHTSPTTFTDKGSIFSTGFIPVLADDAELNSDWYLLGRWDDLTGNVSGGQYNYTFGTLTLFATTTAPDFGTDPEIDGLASFIGADDDTGFTGVEIAQLSLISGFSTPTGVKLNWKFDSLLDGFWLAKDGVTHLTALDANYDPFLLAFASTDNNYIKVDGAKIYSDHDGSVSLGVVPEPASMLLFGSGLFGLVGAGIKKRRIS